MTIKKYTNCCTPSTRLYNNMLGGHAVTFAAGVCLAIVGRIVCSGDDRTASIAAFGPAAVRIAGNFSGDSSTRSQRFVAVSGDGVPDYDGGADDDDNVVYDYDDGGGGGGGGDHDHGGGGGGGYDHGHGGGGYDHDHGGGGDHDHDYHDFEHDDGDDDDFDFDYGYGPGYHHHVWWHHYYHHGEPHLPFPLFPPIFVYRRPVHRRCDRWPFVCRSTYEMIQWLQCYHEFVGEQNGDDHLHGLHSHAWRK